jgi:hypothetical protein
MAKAVETSGVGESKDTIAYTKALLAVHLGGGETPILLGTMNWGARLTLVLVLKRVYIPTIQTRWFSYERNSYYGSQKHTTVFGRSRFGRVLRGTQQNVQSESLPEVGAIP